MHFNLKAKDFYFMKLSVVTESSLWYIVLCLLVGLFYAAVLYFKEARLAAIPKRLLMLMGSLRFILVFLLSFLLMNPLLKTIFREVEKPVIVFAQDVSASMVMGKDSVFIRTEYLNKIKKLTNSLSEKFDVVTYSFGSQFREKIVFDFKDKVTDFSSLFDELQTRYSDRNLGAIIVASDGIFNQGQSPVYSSSRIKAPIFCIAMGDTTIYQDLILTKVIHNKIAFLGNTFPLDVIVDAHQCQNTTSILTIRKGQQIVFTKSLNIPTNNFNLTLPVELTAASIGLQHYTVSLSVLDGEHNKLNNIQDIYIDILDGREKVLIVGASPHPDMGALKLAIESNANYEVETFVLNKFINPVKKYNLAILHNIPSANFNAQQLLADLALARIPVFYITGAQNRFTLFNELNTGIRIQTNSTRPNECEAILVNNFPLFNLSEQVINYSSKLPAVLAPFGNFQKSTAVTQLFTQKIGALKTDYPLWIFSRQGERKISIFVGEGLWKWRMHDFADHGNNEIFNELIGKTVQYLTVREEKSLFRVQSKSNFLENESILMEAEVYNQSYELINTPDVSIEIIDESGRKFPFIFSRVGQAYRLDAKQFPIGEFNYLAKVKVGDKLLTKKGSFSVSPLLVEMATTTANHQILYQLSKKHNGDLFSPLALDSLAQVLNSREDIKPVIYNTKKLIAIINLPFVFFILILILSMEWFIRKRFGAY